MRTSESTDDLFAALAKAQAEIANPAKDKQARVPMKSGGTYSYTYADIADVLNVVRPALAKHGLAVMQTTSLVSGDIILVTRIGHASGQWIEADYPVCQIGGDHRTMGAALTYARRYALCPMVGIAADEDTDGECAAEAPKPASRRAPPPAPVPVAVAKPEQPQAAAIAYMVSAETEIMNADIGAELVAWWNSTDQKQARREADLPADMLETLKAKVSERANELRRAGLETA